MKITFRFLLLLAVIFLLPTTSYEQSSLPAWLSADIGSVAASGSSLYEAGDTTAYVNAAGSGITGSNDSFHFLYSPTTGDCEIVAHLSAEVLATGSAQAGLMMRATLATNSANAYLRVLSSNGSASLSRRSPTGSSTSSIGFSHEQPSWLKITRTGNYFSAYVSLDGRKWSYVDCRTISMAQQMYVGFAVASNTTDGSFCSSVFDHVQLRSANATLAPQPINLTKVASTDQSTSLQWAVPSNAPSGLTFDVFRDGVQVASGLTSPSCVDNLLTCATAFNYTVRSVSSDGASISPGTSLSVATLAGSTLPAPWATQLLGSVSVAGSAAVSAATPTVFSLGCSGTDIADTADSFRYVYQPLSGNGVIIARVNSLTQTDNVAKAGVMIRESLAANSAEASLLITPGRQVVYVQRPSTGAASTQPLSDSSFKAPGWLMLSRKGNAITAYTSINGVTWTQVYTTTLNIATNAYVGLALTSHANTILAQTAIDQVKVSADTQPPNTTANLAATARDTFVALSWDSAVDDGQVIGYDIYRNGVKVGSATTNRFTDRGLQPSTSYSYSVVARDTMGNTSAPSTILSVSTIATSLPSPWQHRDVGSITTPGTADFAPAPDDASGIDVGRGIFTMEAAGLGIGMNDFTDQCHYVYKLVMGDFQMTARVNDVTTINASSMAGIMFRESLDKDARDLALMVSATNGVTFYRRFIKTTTSSAATSIGAPPCWVRLQRRGSVFTALVSTNGVDWNEVGSEVMDFSGQLYIGMAATSIRSATLTTTHLDHVLLQFDSNGDGVYDGSTQPAQPPGYVVGTPVVTFSGGNITNSNGPWTVDADTGYVACDGGRGYVEYAFSVADRNIYEIAISGGGVHYDPYTRAYNLIVSIDGISLGTYPLYSDHGGFATIRALTPYLTTGAHTLRVFWDNTEAARTFSLQQIKIAPVTGAAANDAGIIDWVGDHLGRKNGMDLLATMSAVSPLCVEGRAEFFERLAISADSGSAVTPSHGPRTRWYANVPLTPNAPTQITASYELGATTESGVVTWATTDLLTSPALTVRTGDSLLLMAAPVGATSGVVQIQATGPASYNVTTSPDAPVAFSFSAPGLYTVAGNYQGETQTASRSIQVKAVSASFNGNPSAYVGRSRPWDNPLITPWMSIDTDSRMEFVFSSVLPGGGTRFSLAADKPEPRYVLARLPDAGPVLNNATINAFTLAFSNDTYVKVVQTNSDGSQVIETSMVLSQVIPGLTYQISLVVSGITFEDGTIVKTLTASDFDATGTAKVRIIRAANNTKPICNTVQVFDGTTSLGFK